ncbi:hypothetical protein [Paenibacillus alkalitolerans]|uniref:hypothetical protein n=1 Tax=Paenibacillus alkalitolerans TaxID=2799335 RepID=UPI0018F46D5F|nr:hypothetical protein [Paenibacillus alkalitolerans]
MKKDSRIAESRNKLTENIESQVRRKELLTNVPDENVFEAAVNLDAEAAGERDNR